MRRLLGLTPSLLLFACVGDSPAVTPLNDGGVDAVADGGNPVDATPDSAGPTPVNGVVVDERDIPVANADVRIGATDAKTDSTGKFTIVAGATYDVLIVNSTQGTTIDTTTNKKLTVFLGLSSRTPRLQVQGGVKRTTTVTVNTTGVATPLPSTDAWYVVTAPTTQSSSTSVFLSPNNAQTSSVEVWTGATPSSGNFYGYLYALTNKFPTAWKNQTAPTPYTMSLSTATFTAAFNGGQPATADLAVTIVPGGQSLVGLFVGHDPAPGARVLFGHISGFSQTTQTVKLPTAGSASVMSRAASASGANVVGWRTGLKLPTAVTVTLPAGDVVPSSPAAAATGVAPGTTFAWTAPAGFVFQTRINCGAAPSSYLVDILSATPSFVLPDAAALGVPLPTATNCTWIVNAFSPVANADALVGPAGWLNAANFTRSTTDGTSFATLARAFTTK